MYISPDCTLGTVLASVYGRYSCHVCSNRMRKYKRVRTMNKTHVYWKMKTHVQRIRCSPIGSHLIHWTSVVFFFRAINKTHVCWIMKTHVQRKMCSRIGSHIIHWTSAVFSHIDLKHTCLLYLLKCSVKLQIFVGVEYLFVLIYSRSYALLAGK